MWAFGLNNFGQLGVGDRQDRVVPSLVVGLQHHSIAAVDGGEHHSIARTTGGRVLAWGRADSNQLGFQPTADASMGETKRSVPQPELLPPSVLCDVERISTSANHCAALDTNGVLFTWGFGEMYQVSSQQISSVPLHALHPVRGGR